MLIEFKVGNYRSFKDKVVFSMVASKDKSFPENVITVNKDLNLLKSAILFGANASGKSNLFRAMDFFSSFIAGSSKDTQVNDYIKTEPFLLSSESESSPSYFEISFILNQVIYRYGFEATHDKVHSEWLYYTPKKWEIKLFDRQADNIDIHPNRFKEGKGIEKKTRPNALFLSSVAQWNGDISKNIVKWFASSLIIPTELEKEKYPYFTGMLVKNSESKKKIENLIKAIDTGINEIVAAPFSSSEFNTPKDDLHKKTLDEFIKDVYKIESVHHKYDDKHNVVSSVKFDFTKHESLGTNKILKLASILTYTLEVGGVLFLDELDAGLHPLAAEFILKMFNSNKHNQSNAQLICTSHSTLLMCNQNQRRDQVWYTNKNEYGITDLYSLYDYKNDGIKIRKDASFDRDYLVGKYGAIPNIDFKVLLTNDEKKTR